MAIKYWLFKSEPESFSIDDLEKSKNKTTYWNGVRNYQARNFLRDEIKKGDLVLFYHSNSDPIAVVGVCEVTKEGYNDFTALEPEHYYYDPKSTPDNQPWFMVDIKLKTKFKKPVTLVEIKSNPKLQKMKLLQKGNRLSVMPVEKYEFEEIVKMSEK